MNKINRLEILQFLLLLVIAYLGYLWKGLPLAIIFVLLWLDRNIIIRLKYHSDFGIELMTLASVLAGIIYGPFFGFFFGFIVWTFVGSVVEFISWMITPPVKPSWPPFIPSPESFINGIMGVIAGVVGSSISLILLIAICSIIRSVLLFARDQFVGWPPRFVYVLNIAFNLGLVIALNYYLTGLIEL